MKFICSVLFLIYVWIIASSQENWSHFRGNNLDGHAGTGVYPMVFNENSHIVWKTAIPGLGWSSPVVWKDQVWLTTATSDGKKMSVICVDYNSGKIVKEILLFQPDSVQSIHSTNSYASPTPAIEDGFVYVHFGTYGTACIRTNDFFVVWKRTDLNCDHMQGPGSSLFIYRNLLIVHVEGTDVQYIAALDKTTGKTVWKTERPHEFYKDIEPVYRKAYITPVVTRVEGRDLLISNGSQLCIAYDVMTGEPVWSVWYGYDSTVGMPLVYDSLVYFNSGWIITENSPTFVRFFAVDPRGKGDVTKTHVKWEADQDIPQISTPVIVDGKIYMVHERGVVTCLDALTGNTLWKGKLRGQFNASPVYAGGNIYISEVRGTVYIIKPGNSFQLVAENKLEGTIKATPAFIRENIILRTGSHLYRIGK